MADERTGSGAPDPRRRKDHSDDETISSERPEPDGWQVRAEAVLSRISRVRLFVVITLVTILALLARVVWLGDRTAHWDEARIAYWAYYYAETGSLGYYWAEHGPFVQLTAGRLFDLLGAGDFAARLPVAVVSGLFPAAAYLYREHLDRAEVVALALFLCFNSVLLYYGRFMRSDVLLAAFMFTSFGLFVRLYDTGKPRYLYGAALFAALGFASKENAIVYVLTWGGATGLLALHALARTEASGVRSRLETAASDVWSGFRDRFVPLRHAVGGVVVFLGTIVFLFAPRGGGLAGRSSPPTGADTLSLGDVLRDPTRLPELVDQTLRSTASGYRSWFEESEETSFSEYLEFVEGYAEFLFAHAPVLVVFAIVGLVVEWRFRSRARPLVLFMAYCAGASVVGYPLGSHVQGDWAWVSTHIVVPLAVPAAVGIVWVFHRGVSGVRHGDRRTVAVVVGVLFVATLAVGTIAVTDVYQDPQDPDNELTQYAQPASDLGPFESQLRTITMGDGDPSVAADGTDVIFYYGETGDGYDSGDALVRSSMDDASARWNIRPVCTLWSNTQPLNWYLAAAGASGDCVRNHDTLTDRLDDDPPPVVVTHSMDLTVPTGVLEASYTSQSYEIRGWSFEVEVFVHEEFAGS